jgi:hypothetical protein
MTFATKENRGLTAVELAIAVAVIALIITTASLYVRQRQAAIRAADAQAERARLQELANREPHKVFTFSPIPLKDTLQYTEDSYVFWIVANPTNYPLRFRIAAGAHFRFGTKTDRGSADWATVPPYVIGAAVFESKYKSRSRLLRPPPELTIEPKSSVLLCQRITFPSYFRNEIVPGHDLPKLEVSLTFSVYSGLENAHKELPPDHDFPSVNLRIHAP